MFKVLILLTQYSISSLNSDRPSDSSYLVCYAVNRNIAISVVWFSPKLRCKIITKGKFNKMELHVFKIQPPKFLLMGILLVLVLCLQCKSASAKGYHFHNRPYARSLRGKFDVFLYLTVSNNYQFHFLISNESLHLN